MSSWPPTSQPPTAEHHVDMASAVINNSLMVRYPLALTLNLDRA